LFTLVILIKQEFEGK